MQKVSEWSCSVLFGQPDVWSNHLKVPFKKVFHSTWNILNILKQLSLDVFQQELSR